MTLVLLATLIAGWSCVGNLVINREHLALRELLNLRTLFLPDAFGLFELNRVVVLVMLLLLQLFTKRVRQF